MDDRSWRIPRVLRDARVVTHYLVAGLGMNLLLIAVFALLAASFPGTGPRVLNVLAALLVMPLSYWVNRTWVFRSDDPIRGQAVRFVLVYVSALLLGALLFGVLGSQLRLSAVACQAVTVLTVVAVFFVVQATWTFASRGTPRAAVDPVE